MFLISLKKIQIKYLAFMSIMVSFFDIIEYSMKLKANQRENGNVEFGAVYCALGILLNIQLVTWSFAFPVKSFMVLNT